MEKILILGQKSLIAKQVVERLKLQTSISVSLLRLKPYGYQHAQNYLTYLKGINMIASFLGPMDLDLDFEALFDAIHRVRPPLKQFLMLSSAGIDHEISGRMQYPGVTDWKEYLNEQRYAAKVVDEEEIPYTILRPVEIVKSLAKSKPEVIEEGVPVPAGRVSYQNVAKIALDVIIQKKYLNQSIAIVDR